MSSNKEKIIPTDVLKKNYKLSDCVVDILYISIKLSSSYDKTIDFYRWSIVIISTVDTLIFVTMLEK